MQADQGDSAEGNDWEGTEGMAGTGALLEVPRPGYGEEEGVGPSEVSAEPAGEEVLKILDGTTGGNVGVVSIEMFEGFCDDTGDGVPDVTCLSTDACTGQLISDHFLLTAGHCIDPDAWNPLGNSVFTGFITVTHTMVNDYCVSRQQGGALSACDPNDLNDWASVAVAVNPEYSGGHHAPDTDTGDDYALIYLPGGWRWPASDQLRQLRLAHGSQRGSQLQGSLVTGDHLALYGAGHRQDSGGGAGDIGTIHHHPDWTRVSSSGSEHFVIDAGALRMCKGDSGGPAITFSGLTGISFGVYSNNSDWSLSCAAEGAKQRWMRTDQHVLDIANIINAFQGPGTCATGVPLQVGSVTVFVMDCS